jgi:hypothetical protein
MKSACCSFTHPLTPSRQGRGNIFGRVLQLPPFFSIIFITPSLRVKRITGTIDRWEGSVTMNYRFTFQFEAGRVLFRRIGTYRHPEEGKLKILRRQHKKGAYPRK